MKKFISLMASLAIAASAFGTAAISAFAEGETPGTPSDQPTETATQDPGATEEPTPMPPLEPLAVTSMAVGDKIDFEAQAEKIEYTEPTVYAEKLAIYASADYKITIDGSNKTINGTKYTKRIKLGGVVEYDENGAPAAKTISVTPESAGTLEVDFAHASSTAGTRTLAAYQNGIKVASMDVEASAVSTLYAAVEAGAPVYLCSEGAGGVNIYGISLTNEAPPATPEPPKEITVQPLPVDTQISFEGYTPDDAAAAKPQQTIIENTKWGEYTAIYASDTASVTIDNSNKTIGDIKYTARLKFSGKAIVQADGTPVARAAMVTPAVEGTLAVDFAHASSSGEARTLTVYQEGTQVGTATVDADSTATLTAPVKANIPAYIYSATDTVNVYGIRLTTGSVVTPAEKCVEITANYDDSGVMTGIVSVKEVEKTAELKPTLTGTTKVFYWETLENMKPVAAGSVEPEQTPVPDNAVVWTVSDSDIGKTAGAELMAGLTLVSDNSSTSNKYITAAADGKITDGVAEGSVLQYTASEDGYLTVTVRDLGNVDQLKTAVIEDAATGAEVASYTTAGLAKETFELTAPVAANKTYYIYGKGTKGRYSKAVFVPGSIPSTWAVSSADVGKQAGDELMAGLTLVSDNSSTSDKYVTAAADGKITDGTAEGSVLKFTAPSNGKLAVKIIDLGNVDQVKTAVIEDAAGNVIISKDTSGTQKDTVELEADVTEGTVYYIYGKGTKARFASASFTPAE